MNLNKNLIDVIIQVTYFFLLLAPTSIHIDSVYGGHYEAYLNQKLSWDDAWDKCRSKGGKLAVIDNVNDKQAIVQEIKSYLSDHGKGWLNLWIMLRRGNDRRNHILKLFHFVN